MVVAENGLKCSFFLYIDTKMNIYVLKTNAFQGNAHFFFIPIGCEWGI